jgi:rhodanese-related sulfurtransferase
MSVTQINPKDAFKILVEDKNSVLVDVRTFEEFTFVGTVDPSMFDGRMILSPWKLTVAMKDNPNFFEKLEEMIEKVFGSKENKPKILFLCRSGARSNAAANFISSMGYNDCFNISGGFEGDLNYDDQRGALNGWKAEKLPWKQS